MPWFFHLLCCCSFKYFSLVTAVTLVSQAPTVLRASLHHINLQNITDVRVMIYTLFITRTSKTVLRASQHHINLQILPMYVLWYTLFLSHEPRKLFCELVYIILTCKYYRFTFYDIHSFYHTNQENCSASQSTSY